MPSCLSFALPRFPLSKLNEKPESRCCIGRNPQTILKISWLAFFDILSEGLRQIIQSRSPHKELFGVHRFLILPVR